MSKKKIVIIISIIIILVIGIFIVIQNNNDGDNLLIEDYIYINNGLKLKVISTDIIQRGDIGINPGKEYVFIMKDKKGKKYRVSVDTYSQNESLEEILNSEFKKGFDIEEIN